MTRRATSPRRRPSTPALNPRHTKFVNAYGAGTSATQAAIDAGFSKKSAGQIGHELLKKPEIQRALAERAANDPAVWTRQHRQAFWTAVASGIGPYKTASLKDRLRASELLGRSCADFVDRHQLEAGQGIVDLLAALASESGRRA